MLDVRLSLCIIGLLQTHSPVRTVGTVSPIILGLLLLPSLFGPKSRFMPQHDRAVVGSVGFIRFVVDAVRDLSSAALLGA